jgi:hypothetical protein
MMKEKICMFGKRKWGLFVLCVLQRTFRETKYISAIFLAKRHMEISIFLYDIFSMFGQGKLTDACSD